MKIKKLRNIDRKLQILNKSSKNKEKMLLKQNVFKKNQYLHVKTKINAWSSNNNS